MSKIIHAPLVPYHPDGSLVLHWRSEGIITSYGEWKAEYCPPGIEPVVGEVPVPGAALLFGSAVLAVVAIKRIRR